jgi:hypothetical protein
MGLWAVASTSYSYSLSSIVLIVCAADVGAKEVIFVPRVPRVMGLYAVPTISYSYSLSSIVRVVCAADVGANEVNFVPRVPVWVVECKDICIYPYIFIYMYKVSE